MPASIFSIYQSETSPILFCSYELLCYCYRAIQFRILTLQGRISTRTSGPVDTQRLSACNLLLPFGNPHTFYFSLTYQVHKVAKQQNPRPGFPERGFCSLRKGLPSLNLLRCSPRMAGPCSYGRTTPFEPSMFPAKVCFHQRLPN